MTSTQTAWERLEEYLYDNDVEEFSVYGLAEDLGIDVPEGSEMIQSYLRAQRRKKARTLYVLKREGRTRSAKWSVGVRTADAKVISQVLFDDIDVKVRRAFKPDLDRLKEKNPHAARYVEARLIAVTDGALKVMAAALDAEGGFEDGVAA